jgi:hypothetical protein
MPWCRGDVDREVKLAHSPASRQDLPGPLTTIHEFIDRQKELPLARRRYRNDNRGFYDQFGATGWSRRAVLPVTARLIVDELHEPVIAPSRLLGYRGGNRPDRIAGGEILVRSAF